MIRGGRTERHGLAERARCEVSGIQLAVVEHHAVRRRIDVVPTVCPAGTVAGFGENDWLSFSRTTLMVIAPAGGGVSLGPEGDELP